MATSTIIPASAVTTTRTPYLEWGPVFAGAIAAAAISFLLLTFGSAIGLSLTSPWPNAGARLWVVGLAVGWWAVVVQIGSFAAGGYLAGRMRSRWGESETDEGQFRDSAHGFMVWAVGVLIGGLMLAWTAGAAVQTATQATATVAGGAASGAASRVAESALRPTDYAVDLLLRGESDTASPAAKQTGQRDDGALRAEAGRIFSASIRNQEFSARDRDYLVGIVRERTGLPEVEAQRRVDAAMIEARDLEIKVRQQADNARRAGVIAGLIAAVSLLIGCVAACMAASLGGRHRDEARTPPFYGHRFW
jgi:hypothetical protein